MRKILGAVLIAAVLAGGSGIVYVGAAASGTSDGSDAAANSGEILEITGETDYSMAQEPGAESEAAFEECFAGSDIPMPEVFFGLTAQDAIDFWERTGEASYSFYDLSIDEAAEGQGDAGNSVNVSSCVEKINRYLTGRGYGREAAVLNEENGRTEIIWYKGTVRVKIAAITEGNFVFTALSEEKDNGQMEMLLGKWEGYAESQGENYIMTLDFREDGQVEYMAGWVQSEAAFLSTSTFAVEYDRMYLTFPHDQVSGQDVNWESVYCFEVHDDTLEMEYLSGDSLNIFQKEGDVFNYSRVTAADSGENAPTVSGESISSDSGEFVLTAEDQKLLREQLLVPETAAVEFQIGEEYYWSAADAIVVPISIYENGVYVAGADISKETKELMTSILTYQH